MIISVLRYPGGKTKAIQTINHYIQLFEFDVSLVLSPFTGGASIELFLSYEYDSKVLCNDKFRPLYLFWYYLKSKQQNLIERIKKLHPLSKTKFTSIQNKLTNASANLSKLRRASYYFAINRSSFSGTTMSGGYSSEAANKRFTINSIKKLSNIYLGDMTFSNLDFVDFIYEHKNQDTFMFLDPPYYIDSKLYGNRGDLHEDFDHVKLRDILSTRNNWLLCYNNCKYIKKLYKHLGLIIKVSWSYGMNKSKKSSEIIIVRKNGTIPTLPPIIKTDE